MISNDVAGLKYYLFESLQPEDLIQAIITRHGGVSNPPWDSLNIGSTVGDNPENVENNKLKILDTFGFSENKLVQIHQVHSAKVVKFDGPITKEDPLIRGDAITTNTPGLLMLMRFADCVPLYFYDSKNHAAAIAHAGWKGTVLGVAQKTVLAMQEYYGSKPDELLVGIGPSIGPDHYYVGDEVIKEVKNAYSEDWRLVLPKDKNGTSFDLWKANEITLLKAGVKEIEIAMICTACERDIWFSHRADNGKTGRFAAILSLK